jgi:hypothetical protein
MREEGVTSPPPPHPFLQQSSGQICKDDVNGFSSTSDICCLDKGHGVFCSFIFTCGWIFFSHCNDLMCSHSKLNPHCHTYYTVKLSHLHPALFQLPSADAADTNEEPDNDNLDIIRRRLVFAVFSTFRTVHPMGIPRANIKIKSLNVCMYQSMVVTISECLHYGCTKQW